MISERGYTHRTNRARIISWGWWESDDAARTQNPKFELWQPEVAHATTRLPKLYTILRPAPMAHSYRLGLATWRHQARIPVWPDICHRGCAYTVLQTVQRPGVYSGAYGTVHYKEPLKSFEIRVGHSPGFGLPSVAILPWLCRKPR